MASTKAGFFTVVLSVLASAFGVQSHHNYQRDFSNTSIVPYVITGIVFVILLIVGLLALVRYITA
ncbi:DUF2970 domain-containing protein [Salinimonas sediminis]|uniref:DUF2970 domain-containing protein n=1 Tax=Salinimonas sediminis TaxID=2303538 RepID=A0A346NI36_9ALTE|nr:DUF2970 domain-containing protein [Salinimonas sediminis]AXR05193.1 DUF2970 domain-containing protein [Salinimonas sediminis]